MSGRFDVQIDGTGRGQRGANLSQHGCRVDDEEAGDDVARPVVRQEMDSTTGHKTYQYAAGPPAPTP
jgi:hypothetical protein